jgi:hypothetical protein
MLVSGLPVFGPENELDEILRLHRAEAVLVASENIPDARLEHAGHACRQAGAQLFRLDVTLERLSGGATHDLRVLSPQLQSSLILEAETAGAIMPLHLSESGDASMPLSPPLLGRIVRSVGLLARFLPAEKTDLR